MHTLGHTLKPYIQRAPELTDELVKRILDETEIPADSVTKWFKIHRFETISDNQRKNLSGRSSWKERIRFL